MLKKKFDVYGKPKNFLINGGKKENEHFDQRDSLKTFEYAAFQKKLFAEKKRQKLKIRMLIIVAILLAVLLLFLLPYILALFFGDRYLTYELE